MSKGNFFVDVSPEMQLYKILQRQSYGVGTALAEFVDNSVQAFIDKKKAITSISGQDSTLNIHIAINSNENEIVIEDNASGINRRDFQRVIKMGFDSKSGHDKESLSVYGIGMKSSAIWFSNCWIIETSALGSNERLIAEFDLNKLLDTGDEKIAVRSEPQEINNHYTKIIIKDSLRELKNQKNYFQNKIFPYLQETFFKFKFLSIIINYDGEILNTDKAFLKLPKPLVYPPVDKNSEQVNDIYKEWKMKIDFEVGGKLVTGFVMIMDTGGYHQPGIRLLRNNRVIIGTQGGDRQNKPDSLLKTANKYGAQRIYGELTLNGFRVNFMKTDFDDNLNEVYDHINTLLKGDKSTEDFIKQTNNFRKRKVKITTSFNDDQNESVKVVDQSVEDSIFQEEHVKSVEDGIKNTSQEPGISEVSDYEASDEENTINSEKDDYRNVDQAVSIDNTGGTKIKRSERLISKLNQVGSEKLKNLYNSLCTVSLVKHPTLSYVGAWSFIESLCSLLSHESGKDYKGDFQAVINGKIRHWGIDSSHKVSIRTALKDIANIGNASKHDPVFFSKNAEQLAVNFKTLEPTLLALINDILDRMNSKE